MFPPLLMRLNFLKIALLLCLPAALLSVPVAHAVSCTTQSALEAPVRTSLLSTATTLGTAAAHADANALQSAAAPSLAKDFGGVASLVGGLAEPLHGATVTVQSVYALHAGDLKGTEDDVQFFCSVPGSQLLTTITLGQLPAGEYALALVHATGVAEPQQFALVLQNTGSVASPHWALAGLFARPMTLGGHPSLWFWEQARVLQAKGSGLSAFLYYQAASYLARPADLYTSNNLDKLSKEMATAEPQGLPGNSPMTVTGENGSTYAVTGLRIDTTLGAMDVRVDAKVAEIGDAVASRKSALDLMAAMLRKYPDLRANFHGFWVYETAANGQTYAVEQPMSALP